MLSKVAKTQLDEAEEAGTFLSKLFRSSEDVAAVRAECPDAVATWWHFKPANAANNAVVCGVTAGLTTGVDLLTKQVAIAEAENEGKGKAAVARAQAAFDETLSGAPRRIGTAIVRDFMVKCTQRLIEYGLFLCRGVPTKTLRQLTTNLSREFKRIDDKSAEAQPSVLSVVETTVAASLILRLSLVAVDTYVDVQRTLWGQGNAELSEKGRAKKRAAVLSRFKRRNLLASGTVALNTALVGLAYVVAKNSKATMATLGAVALLIGDNTLYMLM